MDRDTIEGLLKCLDQAIVKREKHYASLDLQYKRDNGHVLGSEYDEYEERKEKIEKRFASEAVDCQKNLDNLCKAVRRKQPVLTELTSANLNIHGRFPRRIALGKLRVRYNNLDFYVPKMFTFPFKKPMYICDESQNELLHKVLLRLMYALPVDKQEYYVFDPVGLGKSMWMFNRLFLNEKLFPQKKIMSGANELKAALKDVMGYMQNLYSCTFNLQSDCADWDSYNRRLYSQKNTKKMLPYKVFIFMDVPDGMDAECFEMFRKLLLHSKECGFLVLFSFNEILLQAEDIRMKVMEMQLKHCVDESLPLHMVLDKDIVSYDLERLDISSIGEKFPDDMYLDHLLIELDEAVKSSSDSMYSFEDMLSAEWMFKRDSADVITIPCGYMTTGGTEVSLEIGDRYPHYLIGGTTGSGKSNLLHNIIMSACWNYSPEEIRVYLLDFKEGVEFSRYSNPRLAHASLVATEANTEYGISVLEHLVELKTKRYSQFKKCGCKDISAFRKLNTIEKMPRILVIIDEFQVLFENEAKDKTIETLTMLAKQGRACGIHLVLATQSLKGIDFGSLAPQFSGRIALKCSAEDSKILLGGVTTNNEEASSLEIPYAILNTAQGNIAGNVKYAVPEAKTQEIEQKILDIDHECKSQRILTETKIFEGQFFPEMPEEMEITEGDGLQIVLGEQLNYDAAKISVVLKQNSENNLLLCGRDENMKRDFMLEILRSVSQSKQCNQVIFIGDPIINANYMEGGKVRCLSNLREFVENYKDDFFGNKKLLVLHNVNLEKEIGFPPSYQVKATEHTEPFKTFWEEGNRHGCHVVAIYDGMSKTKMSGLPLKDFLYRVGFALSSEEKNQLLDNSSYGTKGTGKDRAFLAENLSVKAWFRPYREKETNSCE